MSTRSILQSLFIRDLPLVTNKPITVLENDTIENVLNLLTEKRFQAVPVMSSGGASKNNAESNDSDNKRELVDVINRKDIMLYVLDHNLTELKKEMECDDDAPNTSDVMASILTKGNHSTLVKGMVSDALRYSKKKSQEEHGIIESKYTRLSNTSTIMEALEALSTSSRLLVVDESGEVLSLISPGDIIKFLASNISDGIASKSLQTLSITLGADDIFQPFDSVEEEDITLNVFTKMLDDNVSAYPICSTPGTQQSFIGHISASDFTADLLDGNILLPV